MPKGKPAANRAKIGEKHNRLTIIADSGQRWPNNAVKWLCRCDCGNTTLAMAGEIRKGSKKSCGCLNNEKRVSKRYEPEEASIKAWERSYKGGAKSRNLNYELEYSDFKRLIKQDCFYCGEPPRKYNIYYNESGVISTSGRQTKNLETIERAWTNVNGIDRIDSKNGYNINNCVPCCRVCNKIKLDLPQDEFLNQVKKIFRNMGKYEKK